MASTDRRRIGVTDLDLAVLVRLFEEGLFPSRPHRRAAAVIDAITAAEVCGANDAWNVLQRLAAPWLSPMPLIEPHGNFGDLYDPAAHPRFVECRLSNTGQLATQSAMGQLAPLPIGLINGDMHLVLGPDFTLWQPDTQVSMRPALPPHSALEALGRLLADPEVTDDDLHALVSAPWLGPFAPPGVDFDELFSTGQQQMELTPLPSLDEEDYPPLRVQLLFGEPLAALLRRWTDQAHDRGDTTPALTLLDDLLRPGTIAPLPLRQRPI